MAAWNKSTPNKIARIETLCLKPVCLRAAMVLPSPVNALFISLSSLAGLSGHGQHDAEACCPGMLSLVSIDLGYDGLDEVEEDALHLDGVARLSLILT